MAEGQGTKAARRVFVSISNKSCHWSRAWESSEAIIELAVAYIKKSDPAALNAEKALEPTFLIRERWTSRIWIVFDLFNNAYDPENAHLPEHNDLPVTMVSFGERDVVSPASTIIEDRVNKAVQDAHDLHGIGSHPPFSIDHSNGNVPTYPNPRSNTMTT